MMTYQEGTVTGLLKDGGPLTDDRSMDGYLAATAEDMKICKLA